MIDVDDLKRRVYHMVAAEPQKASDIIVRICGHITPEDVREAIWGLLMDEHISLDSDRVLRAVKKP